MAYRDQNPDALILSGATDIALRVTKKYEFLPHILDISQIPELKTHNLLADRIEIGAEFTLAKIEKVLPDEYSALAEMLNYFGSVQIRNVATLGGNIGSASPIGDSLPVLMAYGASVILESLDGKRKIPVNQFITGYRKTRLTEKEIITRIVIPKPSNDCFIRSYKNSKRNDLDISSVSGAFRLILKEGKVKETGLYFGGMAATPVKASITEENLLNKEWNRQNIESALQVLEKEFNPISDARTDAPGRTQMAKNMLLKFWADTKTKGGSHE